MLSVFPSAKPLPHGFSRTSRTVPGRSRQHDAKTAKTVGQDSEGRSTQSMAQKGVRSRIQDAQRILIGWCFFLWFKGKNGNVSLKHVDAELPEGVMEREFKACVFIVFYYPSSSSFSPSRPSTPAGTRREFIWCLHSPFKLLSLAFLKALSVSLSLCSNYYLFSSLPLYLSTYLCLFFYILCELVAFSRSKEA